MHFSITGVSSYFNARCLHNVTMTRIFNRLLNGVYVRNRIHKLHIVVFHHVLAIWKMWNFVTGWVRNSLECLQVFKRTYVIRTKLKIFPESRFLVFVIENMFVIKFYLFIAGIPDDIYMQWAYQHSPPVRQVLIELVKHKFRSPISNIIS